MGRLGTIGWEGVVVTRFCAPSSTGCVETSSWILRAVSTTNNRISHIDILAILPVSTMRMWNVQRVEDDLMFRSQSESNFAAYCDCGWRLREVTRGLAAQTKSGHTAEPELLHENEQHLRSD